ncbi:MAG: hypothetical protein WBW48_05440 [Anaerolineae bacterium]
MVNVVEANLLAVDAEDAAGEVFNVTCGKRYNLLELEVAFEEGLKRAVEWYKSNRSLCL